MLATRLIKRLLKSSLILSNVVVLNKLCLRRKIRSNCFF